MPQRERRAVRDCFLHPCFQRRKLRPGEASDVPRSQREPAQGCTGPTGSALAQQQASGKCVHRPVKQVQFGGRGRMTDVCQHRLALRWVTEGPGRARQQQACRGPHWASGAQPGEDRWRGKTQANEKSLIQALIDTEGWAPTVMEGPCTVRGRWARL